MAPPLVAAPEADINDDDEEGRKEGDEICGVHLAGVVEIGEAGAAGQELGEPVRGEKAPAAKSRGPLPSLKTATALASPLEPSPMGDHVVPFHRAALVTGTPPANSKRLWNGTRCIDSSNRTQNWLQ